MRLEVLQACRLDKGLRLAFWEACRRDVVFWVNMTCWVYEPRTKKKLPWLTWDYQEPVLREVKAELGKRDIWIEKSRDMGATWMCLAAIVHEWQFEENGAFMLVSRNQDLVDSRGDPDSLFWKVDFLLATQPRFLLPEFDRIELHLGAPKRNNVIDGASTTSDVGRGGRRTAVFLDEFGAFGVPESHAVNAATAANTNCRIMCSTYKGAVGAFYEQRNRANLRRISLPWTLHPEKMRGAERDETRRQGWSSPWYRQMCETLAIPALIAQELDMDPAGAASMFFSESVLRDHERLHVRPPVARKRFTTKNGKSADLLLWDYLDPPPKHDLFVVACDLSMGTGATPSVLSVGDRRTRDKIAELATPFLSPDEFAEIVVQVCNWFNGAFLIWEMNGPGVAFGKRVVDLGYGNIYYRQDEIGLTHKIQSSLTPGWHASPQNKMMLLQEYARSLGTGGFINHSEEALKQCRSYVYLPNGQIANQRSLTSNDPSGARQNHGDYVVADALCCKGLGAEPTLEPDGTLALPDDPAILLPGHPLHHTQHARMLAEKQNEGRDDYWSERRNQWDARRFKRMEW